MRVRHTITFIISKNYGSSLSLGLSVWQVYLGIVAIVLILGALLTFSLLYLFSFPIINELKMETRDLQKEVETLRDRLLSRNQKTYHQKILDSAAVLPAAVTAALKPPLRNVALSEEGLYQPPYRVASYTIRVDQKRVDMDFRLISLVLRENNTGGYVIAVLENQDKKPLQILTSPKLDTNQDGFPNFYKTGAPFYSTKRNLKIQRRFRRKTVQDYFTHVTLYIFSIRGGLLIKERMKVNKDLFLSSEQVSMTQKISTL